MRISRRAVAALLTCVFLGAGAAPPARAAEHEALGLIRRAGNCEDEAGRYRLLRQARESQGLPADLGAELDALLPLVDAWANGKEKVVVDHTRAAENGYLCRFISRVRPAGKGPVSPPAPAEGSPLRPVWAFYRARMLVWQVVQSGPLLRVKESREAYYGEARKLLEEAAAAYPENRVIGMYLGRPIPWPKERSYAPVAAAPEWANLQREGLEKLADVIHWWADERQLADGQFGGGWGDDVEMWRWWVPVLIAFEDPKAAAAQERLSDGMFKQPHMKAGFTSRVTDVEHSNEDTTDTILPMMHLKPDDPAWRGRAVRLAELMRDKWTGQNEKGFLQYKSIYFGVDKVDASPARAFDTVYHPSIIQPSLLYWQRTGDPEVGKLVGRWLKLWIDATARAENGKPAGVLPSAVRWPDGGIGAAGKPWWEPFSPGHNDALYNWPGAARLMTSTLLLAWHMTGDEAYLEPIRSMAAIRSKHPAAAKDKAEPGSEAWCGAMIREFLPDTLAKYRFLTGDKRYDGLLAADASGYVRFRLTGETRPLERALRKNAEAFASNWEAYTAEMRWTDRVMSFTRNYLQYVGGTTPPPTPSPEVLYSTATGDPGTPLVFPLNAVRWLTPPRQIAALVSESGRDRFAAELFHFGDRPRPMGAELYLLREGRYVAVLLAKGAGGKESEVARFDVAVKGPRTTLRFELPPGKLCTLRVSAAGR